MEAVVARCILLDEDLVGKDPVAGKRHVARLNPDFKPTLGLEPLYVACDVGDERIGMENKAAAVSRSASKQRSRAAS